MIQQYDSAVDIGNTVLNLSELHIYEFYYAVLESILEECNHLTNTLYGCR